MKMLLLLRIILKCVLIMTTSHFCEYITKQYFREMILKCFNIPYLFRA